MNEYLQTFANMDKPFEWLQKVKRYRILSIVYAGIGALNALIMAAYFHWILIYCCFVCLCIAEYYFYKSKAIDKAVLDLADCNITVETELISVYQAAKTGKYETLNLYYDEIEEVALQTKAPVFYVKLKPSAEKSSYFIDGNNTEEFLVAEIEGKDYYIDEFHQIYKTFIDNLKASGSNAEIPVKEAGWKERSDILNKFVPAIILCLPVITCVVLQILSTEGLL